ncbi:hypothetical protein [Thalassobaculum salexigens]|uniref:hypothetical protein n=1 Tax=Thalassobaculum salexigens TaxID=455360 RepID=UPI0003F8CE70|nr:hypothetical protein [Thalassobaculum salexigens]
MQIKTRAGLLMGSVLLGVMLGSQQAQSTSPLPIFRGVERFVVFCGRPVAAEQREALCTIARDVLAQLTGRPVAVGTAGLSDEAAITVLVNGFPTEGPNGPVLAINIDLLRKDQVNAQLFGAPPVLVSAEALVTAPEAVADGLRRQFAERVVDPWRRAVPSAQSGAAGKRG